MRVRTIILLVLCLLSITISHEAGASAKLAGDHYQPREPVKGDEVSFFVLFSQGNGSSAGSVQLLIEGSVHEMEPYWEPDIDNTDGEILYHCVVIPQETGTFNITYKAFLDNGSSIILSGHPLTVFDTEKESDDLILGLPRTYCVISVLFITFIVIFLTWSYFKGRRMQKETEERTGASKIACSTCGATISMDDEKCPKCGAEFDEEEHICGSCGAVISGDDRKCRKCGVRLKLPEPEGLSGSDGGEDPDLKKIGKKVDMSGKVKCKKCGTVYLKKEGKCPECGRN
ncbi:MAG: hypothetical protein ACMUHY_09045 [Thermoplasmatota archaeon]